MKYAIVLPDGAADESLPQLDGQTPLEAARIPNIDWIASHGRMGRAVTVPDGFIPGTDVATLALFGYDPHRYYSGRAPIEAAAKGLTAADDELIFRCNFVTIADGRMRDFTAGHITQEEADRLIADLNDLVRTGEAALHGCRFYSGVSYRNLMIAADATGMKLKCAPPHDIPNEAVTDHQPVGDGRPRVQAIMRRAADMLADHEINRARRQAGRPLVSDIWLWGQGRPVALPPFAERYGVRGAAITGVDIIRGLAVSMGMQLIHVDGITGYLDTNYAGKGEAAVRALDEYDLAVVHVEAPDEASHQGNPAEKVKALEKIDEHVVGPLLERLCRQKDWRILVAPDHHTLCSTTAHDAAPPPFCFAGSDVRTAGGASFSEANARATGRLIDPGCELMEYFFGRKEWAGSGSSR